MEDKYYTPDISEFFAGFEFEWFDKDVNKYHQQEDIESLGFVRKGINNNLHWFYTNGKYYISYLLDLERFEIFTNDVVLFNGKIKNLSELKRILTMVGVI